jgi:hypothetical protein
MACDYQALPPELHLSFNGMLLCPHGSWATGLRHNGQVQPAGVEDGASDDDDEVMLGAGGGAASAAAAGMGVGATITYPEFMKAMRKAMKQYQSSLLHLSSGIPVAEALEAWASELHCF